MPYTVIGAGALVGLIGGGMELWASSTYKDLNTSVAKCNSPTQGCSIEDNQHLVDMRKSGDTKRTLGYIGYGVGGPRLAAGPFWPSSTRRTPYRIPPDVLEEEKEKAPQDKPHSVSFAP